MAEKIITTAQYDLIINLLREMRGEQLSTEEADRLIARTRELVRPREGHIPPTMSQASRFIDKCMALKKAPRSTSPVTYDEHGFDTSLPKTTPVTVRVAPPADAFTKPPVTKEPVTPGMYKKGDVIYKVQIAVHGSGNPYAKRLIPPAETGGKATFSYAPGMVFKLSAADRMTLEDAKAFGALYGTCCVCGRTLTDEGSIAAGIGPVCAGKI